MNKFLSICLISPLLFLSNNAYKDMHSENISKNQDKKPFIVFNALLYKNTPDLTSYGLHKINMIYEDDLLDKDPLTPSIRANKIISPGKFAKQADLTKRDSDIPVVINIEGWRLTPSAIKKSIPKYLNALSTFKSLNSTSKIGYYGWTHIPEFNRNSDVFYPSCYTYDTDTVKWKNDVIKRIKLLRSQDPNKPIYGFVWPQYTPNPAKPELGFTFVPTDIWNYQLEILYKYADGIVVWSHYRGKDKKPIDFSFDMPWWKGTMAFINKHNIK